MIPSIETQCDTWCQLNHIFYPCLQEIEASAGNIHAAVILCAFVLACFNVVLDVTFLAPC